METMTNSLESQFSFGFFGVNEVVEVNKILANEKEEASHAHEGIVITKEQIFSIEPQKLNLDNGIPVVPYPETRHRSFSIEEKSSPQPITKPETTPDSTSKVSWANVLGTTTVSEPKSENPESLIINTTEIKKAERTDNEVLSPGSDVDQKSVYIELGSKIEKWMNEVYFSVNHTHVPHGFRNPSENNCFANAVVQTLFACRPFVNLLKMLPKGHKSISPIHHCLRDLLTKFQIWDRNFKQISRRALEESGGEVVLSDRDGHHKDLKKTATHVSNEPLDRQDILPLLKSPGMDDGQQHDAEEFLTSLLDKLCNEYNKIIKEYDAIKSLDSELKIQETQASRPSESEEWESVKINKMERKKLEPHHSSTILADNSPVTRLFKGIQMNEIYDKGKGNILGQSETPFLTLHVNLKSAFKPYNEYHSLEEALENLSFGESISGYEFEGKKVDAEMKYKVKQFPPILIIALKRFMFNNMTGQLGKIQTEFNIPDKLQIPDCLTSSASKPPEYSLFGVVYHHGQKLQTGHYTSEVKVANDWWCSCDDEKITLHSERQRKTYGTKTSYLLMYMNTSTVKS